MQTASVDFEHIGLWFLPLLPLLGSIIVYLFGSKEERHWQTGWAATIIAGSSFLLSLVLFKALTPDVSALTATLWQWMVVGDFSASLSLRLDHLSAVMCLIITGVGSLIHLYAIGYMEHDDARPRFFCYLNLFLFAMLLLVLGDNMLMMFVGWEGVGLCSYLLIGFWHTEMPNAEAGQKAFVVNRIGDAGFLLGIFTLFAATGSVIFADVNSAVPSIPPGVIELAAFLLLIGAAGKSAQVPLYIWLPDAMAGPTPVSALIHAATMVTAGVYMISRLSVLYLAAPMTLTIISVVGAVTALLAATIALVQYDIKKVLAYSTVSQLGYMFMALGAGAFSTGMYHVVTHAFFKALLFMAAGSVIMGCHHEQDMRKFGGLWKPMFVTALAYCFGTYAIAGLPYGSGFFSKDQILWAVASNQGLPSTIELFNGLTLATFLWIVGVITAALTAFYMTRSLMLTFAGKYRGHEHPHESPLTVLIPLALLSVPSILFGLLFGENLTQYLASWTRADLLVGHAELAKNSEYHTKEMISMWVAISSASLAVVLYGFLPQVLGVVQRLLAPLHSLLINKWWVDEIFALLIVSPLRILSELLFKVVDRMLIDSFFVNGSGMALDTSGGILRKFHSGNLGSYMAFMFIGSVIAILFWLVF